MIRIVIADDQDFVCEILQTSLEAQADLQVVGRASNGEIALEKVRILEPNIVLMDINMPKMNGLVATQKIAYNFPETKVIIFSSEDGESLRQSALDAGAKSYISKMAKTNEIIAQVRSVYQTYCLTSPELNSGSITPRIAQVQQEFKDYVHQIAKELNRVRQTEITIQKNLDTLSTEATNFEAKIQALGQAAKVAQENSLEINKIKILLEGQLSYVHHLNRRAKDIRWYLGIACVIGIVILILLVINLLS